MSEDIPAIEVYRGVGLHDQQPAKRLEVVRRAIDAVYDEDDLNRLLEIAGDPVWAPEARLFAAAKLEAMHQIAADERKVRPSFNLTLVQAMVAGLSSSKWPSKLLRLAAGPWS